jgi:vacuolar-type H+-ATPase subunit F/Vma7
MNDQDLIIAMIGTSDQITFMRMGGIGAWRIIREEGNVTEQVRAALAELKEDTSIGIIIIPENLIDYAHDEIARIRQQKSPTPVIVEIPTSFDQGPEHIKEFYQALAKKLIGFNIEI